LFISQLLIPKEGKQDTAAHVFQGFLHILTGNNAAVIFLQDHINGLPKVPELDDTLYAANQYDQQQPTESQ
jgi:hypothetical protein